MRISKRAAASIHKCESYFKYQAPSLAAWRIMVLYSQRAKPKLRATAYVTLGLNKPWGSALSSESDLLERGAGGIHTGMQESYLLRHSNDMMLCPLWSQCANR
jgi:hypothetical protein